jgi:CBS domain-containing protein
MSTIADVLNRKQGVSLQSARPTDTVLAATKKMNDHGIGALLVMDDDERLSGIFTERDVLRRVVAVELAPSAVKVCDVMTTQVACCTPDTSVVDAQNIFRQNRIRHLPVVSAQGEVLGLVSIGDLNAYHTDHQEVTIHYMHEYLHGRT